MTYTYPKAVQAVKFFLETMAFGVNGALNQTDQIVVGSKSMLPGRYVSATVHKGIPVTLSVVTGLQMTTMTVHALMFDQGLAR